jgi:hypothetical protein
MPQDKRIARWLAQLARLYTGEQRRLTAAYRRIVSRLEPERLQLTASMERLERAGNLTPQNVRDLAAYGRLLARTADELNGYGRVLESSLARISDGSIQLGTEAAWNLSAEMAGRLGEVVRTAYRQPDTDAIRQLVRYVDSDAMRANLAKFGQAGGRQPGRRAASGLGQRAGRKCGRAVAHELVRGAVGVVREHDAHARQLVVPHGVTCLVSAEQRHCRRVVLEFVTRSQDVFSRRHRGQNASRKQAH